MKRPNTIQLMAVLFALALALDAWLCHRAAQGHLKSWSWLEWSNASNRHPALFVLSAMLIALLVFKRVAGKIK